jgi:hypothetical protein
MMSGCHQADAAQQAARGASGKRPSRQRAAIMVSEVLRFLSAAGKAGVLSARCVGLARRLNLTFTRL